MVGLNDVPHPRHSCGSLHQTIKKDRGINRQTMQIAGHITHTTDDIGLLESLRHVKRVLCCGIGDLTNSTSVLTANPSANVQQTGFSIKRAVEGK